MDRYIDIGTNVDVDIDIEIEIEFKFSYPKAGEKMSYTVSQTPLTIK